MTTPAKIKQADAAIQHFEKAGREVVGLQITKDGYKIEFAQKKDSAEIVDLVNMSNQ